MYLQQSIRSSQFEKPEKTINDLKDQMKTMKEC